MLKEIYPKGYRGVLRMPALCPHATGFIDWLVSQGYPPLPIRLRLCAMRDVDALLCARGVSSVDELTEHELFRSVSRVSSFTKVDRAIVVSG